MDHDQAFQPFNQPASWPVSKLWQILLQNLAQFDEWFIFPVYFVIFLMSDITCVYLRLCESWTV